jgi:hypothetical protein
VKGCGRLHQGKQGLPDLFFCRAHRNVYAALMMKDWGEGCDGGAKTGAGAGAGSGAKAGAKNDGISGGGNMPASFSM